MTPVHRRVLADIAKLGFAAVEIMPETEGDVRLAYTIGLQRWGWPELYVLGLQAKNSSDVLASAVSELRDRRVERPVAGMILAATIQGYVCDLAAPAEGVELHGVGLVSWLAEHDREIGRRLSMLQLRWPDGDGNLPDEARCSPAVAAIQSGR